MNKFRASLLLTFLAVTTAALGQATRPAKCVLSDEGTCTIGNSNGAFSASFEEIPSGSPSGVSVTIQGCMQGGTCDSAADTNTATSAAVRGVNFTKVYDYFLVTASLSGGSSPKITINTIVSTANNHQGGSGGGGCIATASTLSASCGTTKGRLATITDGSTTSDCTVGSAANVVACVYTGSAWAFAGNAGSAPTFAQVTTGTNSGQTFTTGTGGTLNTSGTATVDFSTLGTFKLNTAAGFVATAAKMLGYDSTAGVIHGWNGADTIWPKTKAAVNHQFLTSYTTTTGVFTAAAPAAADLSDYGSVTGANLFGAAGATVTINSQACALAGTCTIPEQVNGGNMTSQAGFNLLTSTANSIGITVTPTNSATNALKFEATGTVAIGGGGTGQTTKGPAFDALSPTTTQGDIIVRGASVNGRLGKGANGTCLTSSATDVLWGSCATGSIGGTGTQNAVAKFTAAATIGDSLLTDNGTLAGYAGTGGLNLSAGPLKFTEIAAPTGSSGAGWIWADSTAHRLQAKNASNTAVNLVVSGQDVNTSDQVVSTHLTSPQVIAQGGTGTGSTLTGLVRGSASAMTAAELSADATTSGSNAVTVVALRGAALPTLAASTGILYDTAGTLSLAATLPAAAEAAHTGDATNTAGSRAMTVVALRNAALPTIAAATGILYDTAGTLSLASTLPTAAIPAFTGDMTTAGGSLATTVSKINNTSFAGTNGHLVSFGAANVPADSALVVADVLTYHTPAAGIARAASGSQALAASELSGDATTSGSNAVTVVKVNATTVPSGITSHETLVGTALNTFTRKVIPDCVGSSNALNFTQSTDSYSCLAIATLNNPMNTLGDMIVGGSAGATARIAGPTSGNSAYILTSLPSGGVAAAPAWSVAGVPVDTQSGASFTIQSDAQTTPDRAKAVVTTNGTTATAVTVPQAGSTGMLSNFPFVHVNAGSVVATDTPTTSTVNGDATIKLVGKVSGHTPAAAMWWSDAADSTGNWYAAQFMPADANGRLGCEAFPALTGDATAAAGSCAVTVVNINGTAFSGTTNHIVGFGAANIPIDTGVFYTNLVTAGNAYTNGELIQAAGANKTTSSSGIATANVVTAASNYTAAGLLYAAGANKTTANSPDWAISTHTLSGGSGGILDIHSISATAGFLPPSAAGAAPTTAGVVAFDTTANTWSMGNGATTNHGVFVTGATPSAGFVKMAGSTYAVTTAALAAADMPAAGVTVDTSSPVTVSTTLNAEYHFNQHATAGTAMTYNLPTAAAGKQFCIANSYNGSAADTGVITVATSASGQFIIFTDGTLSATGGNITSGGAAADAACVVGVDATHWMLYVNRGTWTKH